MRDELRLARILTLALVIAALPFAMFAATEKANHPIGRPAGGGSNIEWAVTVSGHESITLSVVDPNGDLLFSKKFNAGRNPQVRLQDLGGKPIDGTYTYEMRVVPRVPPSVAAAMKTARAAGDDAAAKKIMRDAGLATSIVQSGSFGVIDGYILSPDVEEPSAHDDAALTGRPVTTDANRPLFQPQTDQVIADNLIVQGSLCVGLDCVSNESFGFDTIRMKENNLRVKFDDTSSIAGYAANDWQLTANDSASGGANKFSIEDMTNSKVPFTVTGNAATNSIFVDSAGRVGFRTATPVLDLSVNTIDTPAIRLEQNNSGGWTAQTWDIAGNESNFFVRDVTGGSRLPLRIRPGAPTSSIDVMATGAVGIGTSSVVAMRDSTGVPRVQVVFDAANYFSLKTSAADQSMYSTENSVRQWRFGIFDGTGNWGVYDDSADQMRLVATTGGNIGIGNTAPSSKLHVNGDVRVTGGSFIDDGTTLNVPDYVFEPGYQLLSIDDLATFVKQNKRLPNVPAATDVKSAGLNISQFQMRLLEKVEELTLYTLAQHEENRKLKERISALERQLAND